MLTITIPGEELWDEESESFRYAEGTVLEFEHSLVSLSKWEAKYHKLFLVPDEKTEEETFGYIKAMLLTPNVSDETLLSMSPENFKAIDEYINDPMTGTTVTNVVQNKNRSSERLSSELLYYWMSQCQIDISCERWHLNRLIMLIKVHSAKAQKPQKVSKQTQAQSMAELNAMRKAKMGTSG